jgi:hypothetical protein
MSGDPAAIAKAAALAIGAQLTAKVEEEGRFKHEVDINNSPARYEFMRPARRDEVCACIRVRASVCVRARTFLCVHARAWVRAHVCGYTCVIVGDPPSKGVQTDVALCERKFTEYSSTCAPVCSMNITIACVQPAL